MSGESQRNGENVPQFCQSMLTAMINTQTDITNIHILSYKIMRVRSSENHIPDFDGNAMQ